MSRTVRLSGRARRDIRANYDWLAERSRRAAGRWRDSLDRAIAALAEAADRHPRAEFEYDDGRDYRELLVGRRRAVYRVTFYLTPAVVEVVAVRHSSQGDPDPADLPPTG